MFASSQIRERGGSCRNCAKVRAERRLRQIENGQLPRAVPQFDKVKMEKKRKPLYSKPRQNDTRKHEVETQKAHDVKLRAGRKPFANTGVSSTPAVGGDIPSNFSRFVNMCV